MRILLALLCSCVLSAAQSNIFAMCRVAVAWEYPAGSAPRMPRFEFKSERSSNVWTRIIPADGELIAGAAAGTVASGRAVFVADLSVPVLFRLFCFSESGDESEPSNEVRVPPIVKPKSVNSLRLMYSQPISEHLELMARRGRAKPVTIPPPLPQ